MLISLNYKGLPIFFLLAFFLTACGSGNFEPAGNTPVGVSLKILSNTLTPINSKSFAPAPSSVTSVKLDVTDSNGGFIDSRTVFLGENRTVSIKLDVLSGPGRIFTAQAFDSNNKLLYFGERRDVELIPDTDISINITLNPTIVIIPASAFVITGETQDFTVSVSGLGSASVVWTVNDIAGGDPIVGTITQEANPATYTAPDSIEGQNATVTIRATSVLDPEQFATATVTIVLPTNFSLTLLRDGLEGAEAAPGFRILRHDPTNGGFLIEMITDASGTADFGDIFTSQTTFSIVIEDTQADKGIISFLNVPSDAYTFNLNTFDIDAPALTTVNVDMENLSFNATYGQLSAGGDSSQLQFVNNTEGPGDPSARFPGFEITQLQSDLTFSLLGESLDSTGRTLQCRSQLDIFPDQVEVLDFIESPSPDVISFTATEPVVQAIKAIYRKGVVFDSLPFLSSASPPSTTGEFTLCDVPGVGGYELGVRTQETPTTSSRFISTISQTVPQTIDFTLPDLSIDSLSRDNTENTLNWSLSGSDLFKLDYTSVEFEWDIEGTFYSWEFILDPSTLNLTPLELPSDLQSLIPPTAGVGVHLNSGGLDNVDGFNDLLQKVSDDGGNIETTIFGGTEFVEVGRTIPTSSRVIVTLTGEVSGIGGVDLTINYDATLVTPISVTATGVASGAKLEINPPIGSANGILNIGFLSLDVVGFNPGEILQLDFDNIGGMIPSSATFTVTLNDVAGISGNDLTSQTGSSITVLNDNF